MRISVVLDCLLGGGAARVATLLANAFAQKGWAVRLLTMDDGSRPAFFQPNEAVQHIPLALRSSSRCQTMAVIMNIHRIRILRQAFRQERPDVVISFLDSINVLTLLATRGMDIPVIVSERTDPAGRKIGCQWELLRRFSYPWANALVCQGQRPMSYFPSIIRRRGFVIPNPVTVPENNYSRQNQLGNPGPEKRLAAMGSLRPEKGFDMLLHAFSCVAKEHPNWSLTIWGEGPDRLSLEKQARALKIGDRVALPGTTPDPFSRLAEADLFVLSSRVEGFPNVLTEAMAIGLPVIATDVGAVPEIIRNGFDGVTIPANDAFALAAVLGRLMGDQEERCSLAIRAPEVLERFSLEKVLGIWEELIAQVIAGHPV